MEIVDSGRTEINAIIKKLTMNSGNFNALASLEE
jgi:hypothetical protein